MKTRFIFLGFLLAAAVSFVSAAPADSARKGITIRVRTRTCIIFDLQEILGRNGAPSTWTVAAVVVIPTPDSREGVLVNSWLVGAKVSGIATSKRGWELYLSANDLAITPADSIQPLATVALANLLQAQVRRAIAQAIEKKTVPAGTVAPTVVAAGLTSGTPWVTHAGSDTTPVTPDTPEQRASGDPGTARDAKAGGKP